MNRPTAELHQPPFVFVERVAEWGRVHDFSHSGRQLRLMATYPQAGEAAFCELFLLDSAGDQPFSVVDFGEPNPQVRQLPGSDDQVARRFLNEQLDHYRRFREEVFAETEQAANHHSYDD